MLSEDDIKGQQDQLQTYRGNVAHLLLQAAQYGGEVFAPTVVANGLREARKNIRHIKEVLRAAGVPVADSVNDEPPVVHGHERAS